MCVTHDQLNQFCTCLQQNKANVCVRVCTEEEFGERKHHHLHVECKETLKQVDLLMNSATVHGMLCASVR